MMKKVKLTSVILAFSLTVFSPLPLRMPLRSGLTNTKGNRILDLQF